MAVAAIRAFYTELPDSIGIAPDPLAAKLLPGPLVLPSRLAARATQSSNERGALVHRGLGHATLGLTLHVALRTRAIDDALREGLADGAKQVVVLGAGLDGRAYRMEELDGAVVFEVDHPSTQADKRARINRARATPLAREVRLVPVDFERDDLERSLAKSGFSREAPSFWIWEGVTVYLTREAIQGTLAAIAASSAPGSRVALTYVRPRPEGLEGALLKGGRLAMRILGEPLRGFLEPEDLAALGDEAHFAVRSDEAAGTWAARYWTDKDALPGIFEWERLAVLERQA